MSGHSKWHNIRYQKGAKDVKRAKLFTKLAREITVAARDGGDPTTNPALRLAVERARASNVPNDNIRRAIRRGTGEEKAEALEPILYEAFGAGGVPLLVNAITDNRNRTTADLRRLLAAHGGRLGEHGSVRWMFEQKGGIYLQPSDGIDKESLELLCIETGAEDIQWDNDAVRIIVPVERLHDTRERLANQTTVTILDLGIEWIPKNIPTASTADPRPLIDALEEMDDVVDVWTTFRE